MKLNVSKGDMYAFVTHTGNAIKGICKHNCPYCYMKDLEVFFPIKLDEKELQGDMYVPKANKINGMKDMFEEEKFIFIGSGTDMYADNIPDNWILRTLDYCNHFDNKYLFQSKNPKRILQFIEHPVFNKSVVCTTIESDIYDKKYMGNAPLIEDRVNAMVKMSKLGIDTYVTIEPIMKFNHDKLIEYVKRCNPCQVNIGANSSNRIKLPEPTKNDVLKLIDELKTFTYVERKNNLNRLL